MALPLPHPTQEKGLHTTQQVLFSGLCKHMRETCISGILTQKTVTGYTNNCIKKRKRTWANTGTKRQSFFPIESPSERKYASSLNKFARPAWYVN